MAEQSDLPAIPDYYANMIQFATTAWDFRMLFGQMIKRGDSEIFEQKVAITLPWLQVKTMIVYLQMNLFIHERANGKVNVPSGFLPLPIPSSEEGPNVIEGIEMLRKKLTQVLATLDDLDPK